MLVRQYPSLRLLSHWHISRILQSCRRPSFRFNPFQIAMMSSNSQSNVQQIKPSEPSNQHFSVGADGKTYVDLSFASEPLGMPAKDGYGWPQIDINQSIGPDNRYTIRRKLGWGMSSSTWLARDRM